jgi:glycosyltransferase involved in cell wall biosynthesis
MRKPVVVSRTGSVMAYFDETCFEMFNAGDERDLARAIRELYEKPGLREELVRRAAQVNEPYRWPHQRSHYQEIVRTLIPGGPSESQQTTRVARAEPRREA